MEISAVIQDNQREGHIVDFSSANEGLWNFTVQLGIISGILLLSNILRQKVMLIRNTLMPTAVLAGFILLVLRVTGILGIESGILEMITYHGIAIGFIALSLRVADDTKGKGASAMPGTGALIVSSYLIQGIIGLTISIGLSYTIMPGMFKAAGILLPMGYGQGPGQANNVGSTYEALGFAGGRSFGLSLAAAGYLSACIVGIIYLNMLVRKGVFRRQTYEEISGSVTIEMFQDDNEMPISESIDRFSVQIALVFLVYLATYFVTRGMVSLLGNLSGSLGATLSSLLWGFNFIVGSALAILLKTIMKRLHERKIIRLQYQNNYLLSRISGMAFDLMIVAGIGSIDILDLRGLWLPFILMSLSGAIVTLYYLIWMSKKIYPGYENEGMLGMYGMMTGTISSGILLLREMDPYFDTPAANNLVGGSSFAIVFGAPMLILIGLAPRSSAMALMTLGLMIIYMGLLHVFMTRKVKTVITAVVEEDR